VAKSARRQRPIYHYRQALRELSEESDLRFRRLFSVMFPLHQVSVRGRERRQEDYEELEWFIVQAIGYGKLSTITALKEFYGLDEQMACYIVEVLKSIGHLTEDSANKLTLTQLGQDSLADEKRYELYENRQILYFDAYTCHPLPHTHYRLDYFTPGELEDVDDRSLQVLFSFENWRPEALYNLARRPDRAQYNISDETLTLETLEVGNAYLPMHIVEGLCRDGAVALRVFTNVRGRRDAFFESLFSEHPQILEPLSDDRRPPRQVIERGLRSLDLRGGWYDLQQAPDGEWRVLVPDFWIKSKRPDGADRLLELGEYVPCADYCVQVWSDDADLRYRAACTKILNNLEHIPRRLSISEVRQRVNSVFSELEAPSAETQTLLKMAQKQGLGQALERLEGLIGE